MTEEFFERKLLDPTNESKAWLYLTSSLIKFPINRMVLVPRAVALWHKRAGVSNMRISDLELTTLREEWRRDMLC